MAFRERGRRSPRVDTRPRGRSGLTAKILFMMVFFMDVGSQAKSGGFIGSATLSIPLSRYRVAMPATRTRKSSISSPPYGYVKTGRANSQTTGYGISWSRFKMDAPEVISRMCPRHRVFRLSPWSQHRDVRLGHIWCCLFSRVRSFSFSKYGPGLQPHLTNITEKAVGWEELLRVFRGGRYCLWR
jgi:hypothetical protein